MPTCSSVPRSWRSTLTNVLILEAAPKEVANWLVNSVQEEINSRGVTLADLGLGPDRLVALIQSIASGDVSPTES